MQQWLRFFLFSIVLLLSKAMWAQKVLPSPQGYVYYTSNCASGGYDYYFFPNNEVVAVWALGEEIYRPNAALGRWQRQNNGMLQLSFHLAKSTQAAPNAKVLAVGNETIYDLYEAITLDNSSELNTTFTLYQEEESEDCSRIAKHQAGTQAAVFFQRCLQAKNFRRKYPQSSEKLLDAEALKAYTKAELEMMRNELFALYNFDFKSKRWQNAFRPQGWQGGIGKVDAFLTEIERKNVAIIQAAEQKAKK